MQINPSNFKNWIVLFASIQWRKPDFKGNSSVCFIWTRLTFHAVVWPLDFAIKNGYRLFGFIEHQLKGILWDFNGPALLHFRHTLHTIKAKCQFFTSCLKASQICLNWPLIELSVKTNIWLVFSGHWWYVIMWLSMHSFKSSINCDEMFSFANA